MKKIKKTDRYPLRSIYFYPTESCNLKCKHCWVVPNFAPDASSNAYSDQNKDNLTFDELKAVIEDCLPLGLSSVKLTGGEPFLHPDIMDYIAYFNSKDLSVPIETNGLLLTKDIVKDLKKYNCPVSVSIDGAVPETHDAIRGVHGSFHKALESVRLLNELKFNYEVIFSLMNDNFSELESFMAFLDKEFTDCHLKINIMSPVGRAKTINEKEKYIDIEEILALNKRVQNEYKKRYPSLSIFLHIPVAFKSTQQILHNSCGFCSIFTIVGLLSDGKVSYCGIGRTEENLLFGNVRKEKMSSIWKNSPQLQEFRSKMPKALHGICKICIHKNQCLGSCVAQTYALTKDLFGPYKFCEEAHRKEIFPQSRLITNYKSDTRSS
ncbi:MAG: radical SAM protein [Candidatus Ancaeobacter aquaticus]|nr:radical SAM protein [Candidatus Ancaeobacter aquaticus]